MTQFKTILDCVSHWERNAPDRLFVTQPMGGGDASLKTWTFKQFTDEARRMAAHLVSLDLPEKSHIALCSKNCAWWVLADLAIWMAGHVSVPLFPTLSTDTVRYILEHSESRLLFVGKLDPVWDEMKKGVPDDLPKIAFPLSPPNDHPSWDEIIANTEPLDPVADRDPEELATIIYTSGSTGVPKGVMHNFGGMLKSAQGISQVLDSGPHDRGLSYLPLAHAMERWAVEMHALYAGFQVFFAETLSTFVQDLQRARPTLFLSVPRLWQKFQMGVFQKVPPKKLERLMKVPILKSVVKRKILRQLGLDRVRFAGSGSAPIPKEIIEWYRRLGLELLEGYGMTENFAYSHANKPGQVRPGYVGSPYDDCECRISKTGEIEVRSPGNMMGYYKLPDETREVLTEDGFIRTGDLGELDEQGRLKVTGRAKEIFKTSKGKYVAPAPIENEIVNHPRVEMCCVCGTGCPQPHALVVLSEEAQAEVEQGAGQAIEQELAEHLKAVNSRLESHEKLQFFSIIQDQWLPENGFLTPTLKIKRAKLEETYTPFNDGWYAEKKPVIWQS